MRAAGRKAAGRMAAGRAATVAATALALAAAASFHGSHGERAGTPPVLAGVPVPGAPPRLSETGLYLPDGSIDPRNRSHVPQYPLWSDGAAKSRWIRLPPGQKIDVSDIDAWRFPAGTTIWKEFAWGGRKVETRMIRFDGAGAYTLATYVWDEEQSDAFLAPAEGIPGALEIAAGKRHSIPGIADCVACHESGPSPVLGFSALQLSDDRDPLAPHAERLRPGDLTLRSLVEEDLLEPPRPDLVDRPPRIRASDPVGRAALGYLSGNCGGCHNDRGPLGRLGFVLLHDSGGDPDDPEPALATAVRSSGRFLVPGIPADSSRIVAPGAPEHTALIYRMLSRRASSQMPLLGTVLVDEEATDLVRRWVESLRPPLS